MLIVAVFMIVLAVFLQTSFKTKPEILLPQTHDTQKRLGKIRNALEIYKSQNGNYPCPSLRTAAVSASTFGTAQTGCRVSSACVDTDGSGLGLACGTSTIAIGSVPNRTLNLPDSSAFDEWGNRIGYAVDVGGARGITVQDIAATPTTAKFFLFSSGPNAKGAFNKAGNRYACGTASNPPYDPENCDDNDALFIADSWQSTSNALGGNYDDLTASPSVEPPCPANVSGCSMWLAADDTDGDLLCSAYDASIDESDCDGADTDEPADATALTTWVDKTGNGLDVTFTSTVVGSKPTVQTVEIGTKPSMVFANRDYGTTPSHSWGNKFTIFTVLKPTSSPVLGYEVLRFNDPNYFRLYVSGTNDTHYRLTSRSGSYLSHYNARLSNSILTAQYDGTANTFQYYQNGVRGVSFQPSGGAIASTPSQIMRFGTAVNHPNYGQTSLAEMIIYGSVLDDDSREQVECYLSKKYGIPAPQCEQACTPVGSCPGGVSGCDIWLDASAVGSTLDSEGDAALNGNSIYTWCDKSPNFRHAAAIGTVTLNSTALGVSRPALDFTSGALITPYKGSNDTAFTISAVVKPTANSTTNYIWNRGKVQGSGANSSVGAALQLYSSTIRYLAFCSTGATCVDNYTNSLFSQGLTLNAQYIVTVSHPQSSGLISIYLNGSLLGVRSLSSQKTFDLSDFIGPFSGYVAEFTAFPRELTANDRSFVESAMSSKWGIPLAGASCPAVTPACPGGLSGCYLWLDASDSSTLRKSAGTAVSANNDVITNWCDKSGYGNNATSNGTNYYVTNAFGAGLNGVSNYSSTTPFAQTGNMYTSLGSTSATRTFFLVYKAFSTASGNDGYIASFANGAYYWQWSTKSTELGGVAGATNAEFAQWIQSNLKLVTVVTNGTTTSMYLNGVEIGNVTTGSLASASTAPQWSEFLFPNLRGTVAEMVSFDSALSAADRSTVQNYLANKWGISVSSQFSCPALSACPAGITGCKFWFDASDTNTLLKSNNTSATANNDAVAYWCDKSGSGNHALKYYGISPILKTNYFAAGKHAINTPKFISESEVLSGDVTGYVVFKSTGGNTQLTNFFTPIGDASFNHPNYSAWIGLMYSYCPSSNCRLAQLYKSLFDSACVSTRSGYCGAASSYGYSTSDTHVTLFRWNGGTSPNTTTIWDKGFQAAAGNLLGSNGKTYPVSLTLGSGNSAENLAEFALYPSSLSDAQIKELSCYLSDKWSLCTATPALTANYCVGVGTGNYCKGTVANP